MGVGWCRVGWGGCGSAATHLAPWAQPVLASQIVKEPASVPFSKKAYSSNSQCVLWTEAFLCKSTHLYWIPQYCSGTNVCYMVLQLSDFKICPIWFGQEEKTAHCGCIWLVFEQRQRIACAIAVSDDMNVKVLVRLQMPLVQAKQQDAFSACWTFPKSNPGYNTCNLGKHLLASIALL